MLSGILAIGIPLGVLVAAGGVLYLIAGLVFTITQRNIGTFEAELFLSGLATLLLAGVYFALLFAVNQVLVVVL